MKTLFYLLTMIVCLSCGKPCDVSTECQAVVNNPRGGFSCQMHYTGYYFDADKKKCVEYQLAGCEPPHFRTKGDCELQCSCIN